MPLRPRARRNPGPALARATLASLALAVLVACTSHRGFEPEVEPRGAPEQEPPPPLPAASLPPAKPELLAWRWIHDGPEDAGGSVGIHAGDWTCAYEHDADAPGELCCESHSQDSRWCVELREAFVPGVALVSDARSLFVADYPGIASGARFVAFDLATGSQRWAREAKALGPQSHSQYLNEVQLRLVDDALVAYGNEAHGAYVEVMDPQTGELRGHKTLTAPTHEWSWNESAPEPEPAVELALADAGECRFQIPDAGPSRLSCPGWVREFEADFVGRGALSSDGTRVYLLTWSRIASGARARAFALADGAPAWARPVEGLGPQEHSKYSNLIQVAIADDLLVIRGLESHGRYAEARELVTGELRWSLVWPPA